MDITPKEFLLALKKGNTESEINGTPVDYSNGFTICKCCGSYYSLGKGFSKHLSNGCLNCEGASKHRIYWVEGTSQLEVSKGHTYFPPRYMSIMFDDGMHYCKDKLQINLFKDLI